MRSEIFKFKAALWKWSGGKASWYFISLPEAVSEDINNIFSDAKRGWGSLPVKVRVGISEWKTSIFPDKKKNTFILPIKAEIRKKENILEKDTLSIEIEIYN